MQPVSLPCSRSSRSICRSIRPVQLQRDPLPVGLGRGAAVGQRRQRLGDLVEAEPDALRRADERHPAQRRPRVAPLVAGGALGVDQPDVLVEAQRRRGDTGSLRELTDGEMCGGHDGSLTSDFKFASTCCDLQEVVLSTPAPAAASAGRLAPAGGHAAASASAGSRRLAGRPRHPLGERGQRRCAELRAEDVVEADDADVAGHGTPRSRSLPSMPMASRSLCATSAVAPIASAESAAAARPRGWVGRDRAARPSGRGCARPSGARATAARPDHDSGGPPRKTKPWCPSDARWSTICRVPDW